MLRNSSLGSPLSLNSISCLKNWNILVFVWDLQRLWILRAAWSTMLTFWNCCLYFLQNHWIWIAATWYIENLCIETSFLVWYILNKDYILEAQKLAQHSASVLVSKLKDDCRNFCLRLCSEDFFAAWVGSGGLRAAADLFFALKAGKIFLRTNICIFKAARLMAAMGLTYGRCMIFRCHSAGLKL